MAGDSHYNKYKQMNNNFRMMNNLHKEEYVSPELDVALMEMEQGIAAGSARVNPANGQNEVKEEWTVGDDDNRTIEW
ncbi:hypothetical protein ATB99_09070 [Elizabethkingia meningoseptica]|nr:hypothetical protein B5G46_14760 [Elizabethkingia meningoseptica]EOR28392.1 hypothetical protein L100_16580 [Elizabethkingia meningoseptica ATCC 13253 = NBRC 12535]KUY16578.1 hypothetical protein ATB99_09070 [Elizabethkingia meningoseptica]